MITAKRVWHTVAAALILMLTAGAPVPDDSYFSPFDLVVDGESNHLYAAGATGKGVVQFDIEEGKVVKTITLPDAPGGLALEGNRLYVTAWSPSGGVHVVDLETGKINRTLPAGHFPCAPVLSPDGSTLFVCNRFENAVSVIDLDAEKVTHRIAVPREPVAAGITPDGKRLLVANHLPALPADGDYTAAEVTVIDTASMKTEASIALPNGSTGLRGLCLSPDGKHAFVTHILARYHLPTTQLERGWMNTNAVSIIDVGTKAPKLLNTVLLDDVDLGAAIPWGAACSRDGTRLLVTHAASHEVSIIDLPGLLKKLEASMEKEDESIEVPNDLAYLVGLRQRVKLSGNGPRGIAIAGDQAYIAEYFTDSLGIIDFTKESRIRARSVAIRDQAPITETRKGEMLFNDARLCFQQWQSCASCHPDGRSDGLNWDLLNDGFGNPKNTKSLLLAHETPPAMITGKLAFASSSAACSRPTAFALPRKNSIRTSTSIPAR